MNINELFDQYEAFNSRTVKQASIALASHLQNKGKLFLTIAGALSSAGIGRSISPLIRQGKIHGISCTGANLEEDLFKVICGEHEKVDWRNFSKLDEKELVQKGKLRVTDMLFDSNKYGELSQLFADEVSRASSKGDSYFPHEYCYFLLEGMLERNEINKEALNDSWVYNAVSSGIPIYVPGWEDSTFANHIVACKLQGQNIDFRAIKTGLVYMEHLIGTYINLASQGPTGFFQLGGGIAGDFPICVVPLLSYARKREVAGWDYFCQVSESSASYGGYSGAPPNEKITWRKLSKNAKTFMIESDATIVAPIICHYIKGIEI